MARPAPGDDEPSTAPWSAPTTELMNDAGAAMFARYAYPPNELGYCGPGDGRDLLEYVSAAADVTRPVIVFSHHVLGGGQDGNQTFRPEAPAKVRIVNNPAVFHIS